MTPLAYQLLVDGLAIELDSASLVRTEASSVRLDKRTYPSPIEPTPGTAEDPFFTQLAARVVVPALTDLAQLCHPWPPAPRPLTAAWRTYEHELTNLLCANHLAA